MKCLLLFFLLQGDPRPPRPRPPLDRPPLKKPEAPKEKEKEQDKKSFDDSGSDEEHGTYFTTKTKFSMELLRMIRSMHQHVRMVSLADNSDVRDGLKKNGFELLDNDIVETGEWHGGRAYVATYGENIVVCFRGTGADDKREKRQNILTDANAIREHPSWITGDKYKKVRVHKGFSNEWQRMREQIMKHVNAHPKKTLFVTGHSLGAALATLCAFDLAIHKDRSPYLFVSGCPRVGDGDFRSAFESVVPNCIRYVVNKDVVPRRPGWALEYIHVGELLQLYPNGAMVPPEKIETDPSNGDWANHEQNVYRDALDAMIKAASKDSSLFENHKILGQTAKAERDASK